MKRVIAIISALLAAAMLAGILAGCADLQGSGAQDGNNTATAAEAESKSGNGNYNYEAVPGEPDGSTAEATSAVMEAGTEAGETSANPAETTSGNVSQLFTGSTVRILAWSDSEYPEFVSETITGEILNYAVFIRSAHVEDRLGLRIVWTFEPGDSVNSAAWNEKLVKAAQAQDDKYDAIAAHSRTVALNAYSGVCADLLAGDAFPYLKLEQTWWPASLTEDAVIGGRLFFLTGDIAQSFSEKLRLCFANKEMLEDAGVTDPYAAVLDGEWTFERFTELCATVDRGRSGNADEANDRFGYIGYGSDFDPWLYAAGMKLYSSDADGKLRLSVSISDLPVANPLEMLKTLLNGRSGCIASNANSAISAFASGRSLFLTGTADTVKKAAGREAASGRFTLIPLPMPKYNRDTAFYRTCVDASFTMYAVPVTAPDRVMVSAFLELMAFEGSRTLTPGVFETDFMYRYDGSGGPRDMFDIIKEGAVLDPGRIYSSQLQSTDLFFGKNAGAGAENWAGKLQVRIKSLESAADKLGSTLSAMNG